MQRAATIQAAESRLAILRVPTQQARGPNPFEGLLDLVLQATFAGWVQEDHWLGAWGESVRPMQSVFADLSAEGLRLLERNCDQKHLDETCVLLRRWQQEHTRPSTISMLELPPFSSRLEQGTETAVGASSLIGMVLGDPETAQAQLGSVMQQTQATLTAGERMSTAPTGALQALDWFVARIAGPAPEPSPVAPVPTPPPGKPFDIAAYGIAAERIGGAVNQLISLVAALDQRLPEVQSNLDEATERGGQALDHATTRLFLIGLSLITAAAVAVLLVRRIGLHRTS